MYSQQADLTGHVRLVNQCAYSSSAIPSVIWLLKARQMADYFVYILTVVQLTTDIGKLDYSSPFTRYLSA